MAIVKMKKLTVFTVSSLSPSIVRSLMKRKCIQIDETPLSDYEGLDIRKYRCEEKRYELESKVGRIESVLPVLHKYSKAKKKLFHPRRTIDLDDFANSEAFKKAEDAVIQAEKLAQQLNECHSYQVKSEAQLQSFRPWLTYDLPLNFEGTDQTVHGLYVMATDRLPETVLEEFAQEGIYCEQVSCDTNILYFSATFAKSTADEMNRKLTTAGASKVFFKDVSETAEKAYAAGLKRISGQQELESIIVNQFGKLSEQIEDIETLYDVYETERLSLEHQYKMLCLDECMILTCWMPEPNEKAVFALLDKYDCAYEDDEARAEDDPPVLLKNNPYSANYEYVLGMYSYPRYGAADPTFVMSIFYFIIFGLMFADVGYGLLLTVIAFLGVKLLKPKEGTRKFLKMFGWCGISSMICGVLFGGWFGDLPYAIMENMMHIENPVEKVPFFNGLIMNPLDNIMGFLILSFAIGGIHMIAGMGIKFYKLCKDGHVLDAIFDIGSWWVLFAGLVLLAFNMKAALIVAGVGALMLILTQGRAAKGPMKAVKGVGSLYSLISYASDVLSYSRILALALVAAVIGKIINLITMLGSSPVGFLFMLIILLVGHVMNLAINVLGTFVHTSRLQYIEFFGKFFEDGGRIYEPAHNSDKYTIEP
ncbi:MAG: hypothetical protein J6023_01015 [Clostridia bacterium]|nr:hypothetical protein [Clostridia bacterium]